MSTEFPYEVISEAQFEQHRARYEPLTVAMRRLIDAALVTDADEATVRAARDKIEQAARLLERHRRSTPIPAIHEDSGRPVVWTNPVVGLRNPISPPVVIEYDGDGRCYADFTLGDAYQGPPGWVHGGICALVLDHILGEAATVGLTQPKFTGTISLRYLRGTPLGRLRAEAWVERVEGVKTFARGQISDADGVTVEAEGVFIMPAWARDAG